MHNENLMVLVLILLLSILGISVFILSKVNKKCKNENYHSMGKNVRDVGPPGTKGERAKNPPSQAFVQSCLAQFNSGNCQGNTDNCDCEDGDCGNCGNTVCGSDNSNVLAYCQNGSDPDDTTCADTNNYPYIAYQASDCTAPFINTGGYLCGQSNVSGSTACPSGGNVAGNAPPNPWGCPNLCQ
jgi:hypothetical protein